MTTPLTTLANLQTIFESTDASQNALLNLYISEASQIICDYCGVADFGLQVNTDLLTGNNTPAIYVRQLPLTGITATGNTTLGSPTITGLSSTANLFVNQSVSGPGIPAGTVIASIGSGTVSLTNNQSQSVTATASATGVTLTFGIAVWNDSYALGGSAPNAFAQPTLLQEGIDFWVDYDFGPGGVSNSGVIYSTNCYWVRNATWVWGLITPQNGPPQGNIKVQYNAGFATIPSSLQAACEALVAKMRIVGAYGTSPQSMSDGKLNVSLAAATEMGLLTKEITLSLNRFKKIQIGP